MRKTISAITAGLSLVADQAAPTNFMIARGGDCAGTQAESGPESD